MSGFQVSTVAEQLLFTTVQLTGSNHETSWTGTAFVYGVDTEGGTVLMLVTNKHVLAGAMRLSARFIARGEGDSPALGEAVVITGDLPDSSWTGHPDAAVDVAVLPLASVLDQAERQNFPPVFFRTVGAEVALTRTVETELDAFEELVFIGYPRGIYDSVNLTPVARRGVTATPIALDYEGKPAFLVDGSVFPGSSGSPVFIANAGTYSNREGGIVVGSRLLFLGVIAAVHVRPVLGRLIELPTATGVETQETLDLGIVFKARAVDECVDGLLATHGLRRASPDGAGA